MNHCRLYSAWVKGGKSNIFAVPLWFRGQKDKVLSGFEDKKIRSSLVSRTINKVLSGFEDKKRKYINKATGSHIQYPNPGDFRLFFFRII